MQDTIETLTAKVKELRTQVRWAMDNNEKRNRQLDALHYVWCDGGCPSGVHRFGDHPPLTQAIVDEAIRNTTRLIRWFGAHEGRLAPNYQRWAWLVTRTELYRDMKGPVIDMEFPSGGEAMRFVLNEGDTALSVTINGTTLRLTTDQASVLSTALGAYGMHHKALESP